MLHIVFQRLWPQVIFLILCTEYLLICLFIITVTNVFKDVIVEYNKWFIARKINE